MPRLKDKVKSRPTRRGTRFSFYEGRVPIRSITSTTRLHVAMASTHPFLFVFLLILPQLALGGQGPPALTEIPLYQDLRQCAQSYVFNWCCTVDVYEALGCPSPPVDECLCREDLRGIGSSFLSKSVNSACSTNGLDLSNALSVWDIYCSREGMEPSLSVETATTTANNERECSTPFGLRI